MKPNFQICQTEDSRGHSEHPEVSTGESTPRGRRGALEAQRPEDTHQG